MIKLVLVFLFLTLCAYAQVPPWDETCESGLYPPKDQSAQVDTYEVNLDLPPNQRWVEIAKKFQTPV